jgi:hypothetical protein
MQRHVTTLHYRSGAASELLAADIAEEHARLSFAAHTSDARALAERAHGFPIRPTRCFDVSNRFGFVMEDGVCNIHVHGFAL